MANGKEISKLYLSLGLDLTDFEYDFATADKKVREALKKLEQQQKNIKAKVDIEISEKGLDKDSIEAIDIKMKHLTKTIENQKEILKMYNLQFEATKNKFGEDNIKTQKFEEKMLKQRQLLANFKNEYKNLGEQKYSNLFANVANTNTEKKVIEGQKQIQKIEKEAEQTSSSMSDMFFAAKVQLVTLFAGVLSFNWFKNANAEMEQYRMQLDVLMKDASKSYKALNDIRNFADNTPFLTNDTFKAANSLIASDIEDYTKYLKASGEWAAGAGASIQDTANVFARIKSGDFGEAIERMRELKISKADLQAEGLRFSSSNEYLGTSQQLIEATERIVTQKFGGMTEKMSHSWSGLWSTFVSNAEEATRQLTGTTFMKLERSFEKLVAKLQQLNSSGILQKIGAFFDNNYVFSWGINDRKEKYEKYKIDSQLEALERQKQYMTNEMYTEKKEKLLQERKEIEEHFKQERKAVENGGVTVVQAWADFRKSEEEAIKGQSIKELIQKREEIVKNIKAQKEIFDTDIAVKKAHQENAVKIASEEWIFQDKNLKIIEEQEEKLKKAMGDKYKASDEFLKQRVATAQAMANYYTSLVSQKETMGEYVYSAQKLLDEVSNINALKGDSSIKKYEALKTAVQEYLSEIEKIKSAEINLYSSSANLQNILQNKDTKRETNTDNIQVQERLANSVMLQERLQTIHAMLNAEKLGKQQRKQLLEEEVKLFSQYQNTIRESIQDAEQKIDNLQKKLVSNAERATKLLKSTTNFNFNNNQIWSTVYEAAYQNFASKTKKTLQDFETMQEIQEKAFQATENKDFKRVNFNDYAYEIAEVAKENNNQILNTTENIKSNLENLKSLGKQAGEESVQQYLQAWKENISQLQNIVSDSLNLKINSNGIGFEDSFLKVTNDMKNIDFSTIGQQAAEQYFSPWQLKIEEMKKNLSSYTLSNLDVSQNAINKNTQNNVNVENINVTLSAEINNEVDTLQVADKVANTIMTKIKSATSNSDEKYKV